MKWGRNEFCPCGSRIKFKKCCLNRPTKITPEMVEQFEIMQAMARDSVPQLRPEPVEGGDDGKEDE